MTGSIVVVGSLNMDFHVGVKHLPTAGETVAGNGFRMAPGGKGANQACAAGKLAPAGMVVRMIGRVGNDMFADHLKASLAAAGVDVNGVSVTRSQPTGVAFIWVDSKGQNSIVVAAGANHLLVAADVEGQSASFEGARFALFQLELPLSTVESGLRLALRHGATAILDPAPAARISAGVLSAVDILTPNESEACHLVQRPPARVAIGEARELANSVLALGPKAVVLTLADHGCYFANSTTTLHVPGFSVEAQDTTAAGDTFNAALAVALSEEMPMPEALRFANAAAAISVTRPGAQASAPSRKEVHEFLASR